MSSNLTEDEAMYLRDSNETMQFNYKGQRIIVESNYIHSLK